MSLATSVATASEGLCPVCFGRVVAPSGVIETEILSCRDCQSPLVVESCEGARLVLGQAPKIEEDWGE